MYFEIRCGDDGLYIRKIIPDEKYFNEIMEEDWEFLSDFPKDRWNGKNDLLDRETYPDENEIILIKGKIIVPEKKEVVTKYEVE